MRISDWSSDVCSSDLDMLFKQQANWTSAEDPIAAIKQIGRLAGIRGETADACMSDEALLDGILKIRLGGQQDHDISSTPTFVIGTEKVVGAQPFEAFKKVIDAQLDRKSTRLTSSH